MRSALKLFAERGIAGTTVEDITEAADVGKGTFFNYFPTKEHVLQAFGEARIQKIDAALVEARSGSLAIWQVLRRLAHSLAEEASHAPSLLRSILVAPLTSDAVREFMASRMTEGRTRLAEIFHLGQERREFRADLPAAYMARAYQQSIFGSMVLWSLDPQGELFAWLDIWLEMFLGGLDPSKTRSGQSQRIRKG
jgi:AcrR family transcriptional regulator